MKDTDFYNAESAFYSDKRYPKVARSFTQYFFKSRLSHTLALLSPIFARRGLRVLELGCADGVVADAIARRYASSIARFDAMDIAPGMIEAAKQRFSASGVRFFVRTGTAIGGQYDVIVEVGVLNYTDLEPELEAVATALSPRGRYVCSLAGRSSLQNVLKGPDAYQHLEPYAAYEAKLAERFRILEAIPVGFFVPHLWKIPALARVLQPVFELVGFILPWFALEKIYVLESR